MKTKFSALLMAITWPLAAGASGDSCALIEDAQGRLQCWDACGQIESDQARLACFDGNRLDSPAVPVVDQVAQKQEKTPDLDEASFGLREKPAKKEEAPEPRLEATLEKVLRGPSDKDYLVLSNGQIWRELQETDLRYEPGRRVVITKGLLGSFLLKIEGSRRKVKVRRVE